MPSLWTSLHDLQDSFGSAVGPTFRSSGSVKPRRVQDAGRLRGYDAPMGKGTVFIFGAGASYGARSHAPPPLGQQLAQYLLGWLDANAPNEVDHDWSFAMDDELDPRAPCSRLWERADAVRRILERAKDLTRGDEIGFEMAMFELMRAREIDLLDRINEIIAVSFLGGRRCDFDERQDRYDDLLGSCGSDLRAIVTPNYDTLAEEALHRRGIGFRYGGTPDSEKGPVTVYKVHGSANWFLPYGGGRGATLAVAEAQTKPLRGAKQEPILGLFNDHDLYVVHSRTNAFLEHKHRSTYPVLATYGPHKPVVFGLPHIERVRAACFDDLRADPPARIVAAGIRPPAGSCRRSARRLRGQDPRPRAWPRRARGVGECNGSHPRDPFDRVLVIEA